MQATAEKKKVKIPYQHEPRDYQVPLWRARDEGFNRFITVWNRRAGKDRSGWNFMIREAIKKKAVYYYCLPSYAQARKAIWDAIDSRTGLKFTDHIPPELIAKKKEDEMKVELRNGSIIQLVGSDKYNALMGTPPYGIVFSEFSLSNPAAWDFFRPILAENGGWALFNFTPRGKNHGYDLYKMAQENDKWFCQLLTVDDTKSISMEAIQTEREAGMDEDMIQQEFWCSFEGAIHGSYYSKLINEAFKAGRITDLPIDPRMPVDTYWDLGMNDNMVIWFVQAARDGYRAVNYYENNGEGLSHYITVLDKFREEYHINYGKHMGPHDLEVREINTGISRKDAAAKLGLKFEVAPKYPIMDGINACRSIIPTVWFDKTRCKQGIRCLENYSKKWDENNRTFLTTPLHNWASHGADGFRTFATTAEEIENKRELAKNAQTRDEDESWSPLRG